MAAGSTYTPIATTTLGSAAASYTFSSISGTYTDLVLVVAGTISSNGFGVVARFNSDSGTNYSVTNLRGSGSATQSTRASNQTYAWLTYGDGFSSTEQCNLIAQIQNYSNSTTFKTVLTRNNNPNGSSGFGTEATVGLWRSTSAITSITVQPESGNLNSGMSLTLYGIAAA
jgi:hypothetical protein